MNRLLHELLHFSILIFGFVNLTCEFNTSNTESIDSNKTNIDRHELDNGMTIDVYTPKGYTDTESYPVLLMNDGQVVFSPTEWDFDSMVSDLIETNQIEPIIIVAIHVNGLARNDLYIPYDDPWIYDNWGPYTPSANIYAESIFNDLVPFLKEEYSINDEELGILGFSLGGLVSTWMGLNYPDQIKYSASLSGSLWAGDYMIFEEVTEESANGQKFWFDIGTKEWNYYVPLYKALDETGIKPGINSFYYEVPDGTHSDQSWLERIHIPLKIFYGAEDPVQIESMKVHLECIPSASTPGLFYRRLNPVIAFTNGIEYSLAHTASYSLVSGDVTLGSEGSFINNPDEESTILVEYQEFNTTVILPIDWCR